MVCRQVELNQWWKKGVHDPQMAVHRYVEQESQPRGSVVYRFSPRTFDNRHKEILLPRIEFGLHKVSSHLDLCHFHEVGEVNLSE